MAYLDLNCIRTPPVYNHPPTNPTPTPPKKSLGEEITDSFYGVFVKNFERGIVGDGNSTFNNLFGPKAPGLQTAGATITVGQYGASTGKSAPSLVGTFIDLGKWFFGTVLPIVARSEPVQAAVKAVTGFVTSCWNWIKSWF
jgi:hypothetical protein